MGRSVAEQVAGLPEDQRAEWLYSLPDNLVAEVARQEWWYTARPEQLEPAGDWHIWLILAGRGFGKTRTGAEWLVDTALKHPVAADGSPTEWAAFAQTFSDCRNIVIEGPSGVLASLHRRGVQYHYQKVPMRITFVGGQRIHIRGADDPDAARGLNLSGAWLDELAKWRYGADAWTQGVAPSLRALTSDGARPRACITTTPRPVPVLLDWMARQDGSVYVTRGSTFENRSNLSSLALKELDARYAGTRIGRQELYGEMLTDVEGALWSVDMIEEARVKKCPDLERVVVAIDPAVSSLESSDETGVVIAGKVGSEYFVLGDVSGKYSPDGWARAAAGQYEVHMADCVIGEVNNGGDLIEAVLRQTVPEVRYKAVHASRGKRVRAEPIAALYEQRRVHHVGTFADLEGQLTTWTPDVPSSPDRLDALVWALTELAFTHTPRKAQRFRT